MSAFACDDGRSSAKALMLSGEPYDAQDPELRAERAACRARVERFNATSFADSGAARAILDELLGELGEGSEVMAPFQCDYGYQIRIGARSFVNYGVTVLDAAEVLIGSDVQIGPGVQLITALHPLDPGERRTGVETAAPISVGDGAWLATGVIVLPGVSVGQDTVVGAGSVATRDLPSRCLCYGNPCRVVRAID
jgi:maltose O-acetyltransferase